MPRKAALALAVVLAIPAQATLMRAMPFDDKVEHAASIVLGKCVATHSQWDSEHRFILTYSTFQIEDTMKGASAAQVTIVTPGGTVGNLQQDTIGVPSFREGEENIVFTKATNLGPTVLYFDQGTYDVNPDEHGEKMVTPRPTGAVLVDTQRGAAYEPEHARTLGEFHRAVRESMDRTRAEKMEMIRAQKQQQSIAGILGHYKLLIALTLIGIAVATWQLMRR
jgi:hypothetical protein